VKQKSLLDSFNQLCKRFFGYSGDEFYMRVLDGEKTRKAFEARKLAYFINNVGHLIYEFDNIQQAKIAKLESELARLRALHKKTPLNSHKSPSSEKHQKIKNSREKSGKKVGGQEGQESRVHELHDSPDHLHTFEPTKCSECHTDLRSSPVHEVQRHQEVEIEDGKMVVTEYQRIIKFCPVCGRWNRANLPGHVRLPQSRVVFGPIIKSIAVYLMSYQLLPVKRTQEILRDLWGVSVSTGSLCHFVKDVGRKLGDWEQETRLELLLSPYLHADESGVRVNKKSMWVHVHSSEQATILSLHMNRGMKAQEEIGILPMYKGHLVHDGFKTYVRFDQCRHSLCNAHILRELKYLSEEEDQKWSSKMAEFLKDTLRDLHRGHLLNRNKLNKAYKEILRQGFWENSCSHLLHGPEVKRYRDHWDGEKWNKVPVHDLSRKSNPVKLLSRLRDQMNEVMAFAFNPGVPFSNNQAERDLRMTKIKEKISGCFRSEKMAQAFLRIRSFIGTCLKKEHLILDNLLLVQLANS
jgi:hypothetical protein